MAVNPTPTLRKKFEQLPAKVREWLASEEATFIIIELNRRIGLDGVLIEVIPNAITRLVVRELEPREFINDISDGLGVDWLIAQEIAQDVERRILRPVEIPLRNEVGVDIKAIFLAKPPVTPQPAATPAPSTPPIYRPTPPAGGSPIYRPAPSANSEQAAPAPTAPITPAAPKEIPVKINVQKPQGDQPFGPDSWVNKVK